MRAGMFGLLPFRILQDKTLSDGDKIMFAIITAHVDSDHKCIENEQYFAQLRGVDERTIRSQIARLVAHGHIYRKKIDDGMQLEVASEQYFTEGTADIVTKTTKSILDYWNSVLQVDIPYTTVIERQIRRRLLKFSPEQLVRAVQGRIAFIRSNTWFNREENRSVKQKIELLLQSDDEIEKYLAHPIDDLSLVTINHDSKLKEFRTREDKKVLD
jgi:DNA-binding transcriptional regulator PaaX